jgi:2-phosphosulfolactate phosphatase
MIQTRQITLDACPEATGLVVAIDVLRAFSSAAYAFGNGAQRILLTSSVEEAFGLRHRFPDHLLMGEVDGWPIPGFDFGNSPSELIRQNLQGCSLIQRTSAGTQGIVRSKRALALLAASFVTARATANAIRQIGIQPVNFVITGHGPRRWEYAELGEEVIFGDEDIACADYLGLRLQGETPEPSPFLERVASSGAGKIFASPDAPAYLKEDLELCMAIDRFDFALKVEHQEDLFIMTTSRP